MSVPITYILSDSNQTPQGPIPITDILGPAATSEGVRPLPARPIADPSNITAASPKSMQDRIYEGVQANLKSDQAGLGQLAGGTVGGIVGPLTIGQIPPLTLLPEEIVTVPLSAAVGSYLGGAAGSALEQKASAPGVIDWRDANKAGLWEAGSELGGRAVAGGLKLASNLLPLPFPQFAKPSVGPNRQILAGPKPPSAQARKVFQDTVKQFEKEGGIATPGQVDRRWWLHVGEGMARGSWVGSEAFDEAMERNNPILIEMLKNTVDDMADNALSKAGADMRNRVAGENVYAAIARQIPGGGQGTKIKQWHALFDPIYARVDELAKGDVVSTTELKRYARQTLQRNTAAKGRLLEGTTRQDLEAILKMQDDVSLQTMRDLRTRWQGKVRQFSKDMNPDMARVNEMSQLADNAIMISSTSPKLSPEARKLLQTANSHYAQYKRVMEDLFPLRMAEKLRTRPELVVNELFPVPKRNTGGAFNRITAVKKALTELPGGGRDPQGQALFDELRQAWLAGLIEQNTEKGVVNTGMLRAQLRRYGKDSLDVLLPPSERVPVENVLNLADALGKRGLLMSGGSLVAKSAQAGGAISLYSGVSQGDAVQISVGGTLLFGPVAFARLATDPVGSKLIRAALKDFPGQRNAIPIATRILRLLLAQDRKQKAKTRQLNARYRRDTRMGLAQPQPQPTLPQLRGFGGRGF